MIHYIARLFDKVGKDEEVVDCIRAFASSKEQFAIVKVGGASLQSNPEEICDDLATLFHLDLLVPVIYGWGDALTARLKEHGIQSERHASGVRVTREGDICHLKEIANEQANILVNGLAARGIPAQGVDAVFAAEKKYLEGVIGDHFTGELVDVHLQPIQACIAKKTMPIIPPLGYSPEGILFNINADTAAQGLVTQMRPQKYIILTNTGGVLDREKKIIPRISLSNDYEELIKGHVVTEGMRLKIEEAKAAIQEIPTLAVQIASPQNILIELFTNEGKGTYITK